jgi:hypothetical protein
MTRNHPTINPGSQQIEELRSEIVRLQAERRHRHGLGVGAVTVGMTGRGIPSSSQLVAGNDRSY